MRIESKVAIVVVGVLVIVGGAWYMGSGGEDDETAILPADDAAQDSAATLAEGSSGDRPADATGRAEATPKAADPAERSHSTGSPSFVDVSRAREGVTFHPPVTETPDFRKYTTGTGRVGLSDHTIGEGVTGVYSGPGPEGTGTAPRGGDAPENTRTGPDGLASTDGLAPGTPDRTISTTRPARPGTGEATGMGTDRSDRMAPGALAGLAPTGSKTHVIQRGDTFSALAARYLGHSKYAKLILEANPNVDPRRLQVGAKVTIPPAPTPVASLPKDGATTGTVAVGLTPPSGGPPSSVADVPPIPAERAHTVQPGESWYVLARRFAGNGARGPELYEYNRERERVSSSIHLLRVGTVIELPPWATVAAR